VDAIPVCSGFGETFLLWISYFKIQGAASFLVDHSSRRVIDNTGRARLSFKLLRAELLFGVKKK